MVLVAHVLGRFACEMGWHTCVVRYVCVCEVGVAHMCG